MMAVLIEHNYYIFLQMAHAALVNWIFLTFCLISFMNSLFYVVVCKVNWRFMWFLFLKLSLVLREWFWHVMCLLSSVLLRKKFLKVVLRDVC